MTSQSVRIRLRATPRPPLPMPTFETDVPVQAPAKEKVDEYRPSRHGQWKGNLEETFNPAPIPPEVKASINKRINEVMRQSRGPDETMFAMRGWVSIAKKIVFGLPLIIKDLFVPHKKTEEEEEEAEEEADDDKEETEERKPRDNRHPQDRHQDRPQDRQGGPQQQQRDGGQQRRNRRGGRHHGRRGGRDRRGGDQSPNRGDGN